MLQCVAARMDSVFDAALFVGIVMIAIVVEYLIRMGGLPVYAGLELIVAQLFDHYIQEEKSVVLLFPGEFYAGEHVVMSIPQ
eukprot:g20530.t1